MAESLGEASLVWYRGNAACHPTIERSNVDALLEKHGASRIVIGHTPTPSREIEVAHGGKVIAIDTGMLSKVYRGNPRALEISDTEVTALLPDGSRRPPQIRGGIRGGIRGSFEPEDHPVEHLTADKRSANREVGAYLLSDYLQLDFVAPVARDDEGIVRLKESLLSERQRQERGLYRPVYCEVESDFDLLSVFDALIGKKDRSLDTLLYSQKDWSIRVHDHGNAFAASARLRTFEKLPRVNLVLREKLSELDEASLQILLDGLLRTREISAILKRRDKILAWPQ